MMGMVGVIQVITYQMIQLNGMIPIMMALATVKQEINLMHAPQLQVLQIRILPLVALTQMPMDGQISRITSPLNPVNGQISMVMVMAMSLTVLIPIPALKNPAHQQKVRSLDVVIEMAMALQTASMGFQTKKLNTSIVIATDLVIHNLDSNLMIAHSCLEIQPTTALAVSIQMAME